MLGYAAKADGMMDSLMPPDPCGPYAPTIVEEDTAAQADLWALNCGRIPTLAAIVANYVPGHPTMYWRQPDPLPHQPSPVPLGATLGYLTVAMLALVAAKGRM